MALLTSASAVDRVVDAHLRVVYARRPIYGTWTYVTLNITTTYTKAWEYSRVATKTYRYVGLTETAAKAKAAELNTLYTRATKVSEWDSVDGEFDHVDGGDVPMADIVVQLDEGEAYSVVVSVNEQDTRISLSANESFASLFSTEDQRTYDDGTEE